MSASRRSLDDLLLYRLSRLLAVAGSLVIRLCEGRFGITRREWQLIATLACHGELNSSQLAEHAQLDRARTSRAIGSLVDKGLASRTVPPGLSAETNCPPAISQIRSSAPCKAMDASPGRCSERPSVP